MQRTYKWYLCILVLLFSISLPTFAQEEISDTVQLEKLNKDNVSTSKDTSDCKRLLKLKQTSFCAESLGKISIDLIPTISIGFSDLLTRDAAPKVAFSWGVDVALQLKAKERIKFIPKNYFSEVSAGFVKRGCSAFHMYYYNLRIIPFGYTYYIKDWNINAKAGLYTAIPFSKVETNINSFKSNMDLGLTLGMGTEYKNIGVNLLYELGFIKICKSNLSMINSSFLINVSYRLFTLFK